ncbi:hypothetical protein [uncultured Cellulomonas sp.]|uniref:hypothetical protein n=1 Tax=uncultured Cellulomonas sp. TaxID=189682 RepID=UPI00262E548B|nr:hypothetical protein [uncultured Cellulomonas sp.]
MTSSAPDDASHPARAAGRRRAPWHVAAWLLATAAASGVAWSAVALIGAAPGQEAGVVLSQAQAAERLADQRAAAGDAAVAPGGPPAVAPAAPGPVPTPGPTDAGAPPGPTDASPSAGGTVPAEDAPVVRVWDVTGGQLRAVCADTRVGLVDAIPLDGWTVRVDEAGPTELEVRFSRAGTQSRVRAECVGGVPEVTREDEPADDDATGTGGTDDDGSGRRGGGSDDGDDD